LVHKYSRIIDDWKLIDENRQVIYLEFHQIDVGTTEEKYMMEALKNGQISGRGEHTKAVEKNLESFFSADRVLMTTSGTHALEMALHLSGLSEGDEVLLPSYTFPSTANAVIAVGATPIFVPVVPDLLSVSSEIIKQNITSRTRAVIAVHYGGVCCDIDEIATYCKQNDLVLIEDAAQAFGSKYNGTPLGAFGDFGCLSFHGTKNDVSGEGGALILPNSSRERMRHAERLLEKGTDRMAFLRGEQSTYEWTGFGSSYVPSDLLMGLLRGQLETFEFRMEKRRSVIKKYIKALSPHTSSKTLIFNGFDSEYEIESDTTYSNAHLFYIVLDNVERGRAFKKFMDLANIPTRQHFLPLHASKMGEKLGYKVSDFPFESDIFERLYRLPVHSKLTESDVEQVIQSVLSALEATL